MVIHSDVSPRTFDASNQQQVGGKTGNAEARRGDKEEPLDLSGPRARLYMPVDKVVAACGKGGSLGEVPHQYEKPWPKVGRGAPSKVERFPQPKAIKSRMPAPAPPPQGLSLHHQRPVGPALLRPPPPTMYRPNRPPRFQPRYPVEKKITKLPSGDVAHKIVIKW